MRIGAFSKQYNVTERTIRHYESIGLLPTLARNGRYRVFEQDAHQRMTFITRCKQIGLTLSEISELIPFFDAPKGERCKASLKVIAEKKASLTHEIEQKRALLARIEQLEQEVQQRISNSC
ncbi:MerR family transcriptional regulator [Vibrio variabilis]|uniref:MerR family transcriptional regulator n=1 Tax=Vibrio variabilis TaxID=990271 RepID=UPI000DD6F01C|nr:MerR family transcriptional regulator [Vibrio variabilis]